MIVHFDAGQRHRKENKDRMDRKVTEEMGHRSDLMHRIKYSPNEDVYILGFTNYLARYTQF